MKYRKKKKPRYRMRFFIILFGFSLFISGIIYLLSFNRAPKNILDAQGQLTISAKRYEFNALCDQLETYYPYFSLNKKYNKFDFLKYRSTYLNNLEKTKNNYEYFQQLNKILDELYEKQTFIMNRGQFEFIQHQIDKKIDPSSVFFDKKVEEVYKHFDKSSISVNPKVLDIKTYPSTAYIKIPDMNETLIETDRPIIEKFLKDHEDKKNIILDLRDTTGSSYRYAIENIIKPLSSKKYEVDFITLQKTTDYKNQYKNLAQINGITVETYDDLKTIPNKNLDKNLLKEFEQYTKINLQINGSFSDKNIYIIQNRKTSNAADFICQFAKRTNFAQTVGEATHGFGLQFQPLYWKLPLSNYLLQMPLSMGLNTDDTFNEEYGTSADINLKDNNFLIPNLLSMIE